MHTQSLDELAAGLAHNREAGAFSSLPLGALLSRVDAQTVQASALGAFSDDFAGYALAGTSEIVRHGLGLYAPIYTPLPNRAHHPDGWRIHLPQGMIGAQCELVFTLGRAFPERGEAIDRRSVADAVLACQPAIGVLGRRARPGPHGRAMVTASAGAILGHPLEAVAWLTRELSRQNRQLNAGDVVATAPARPCSRFCPASS